jgi:hypothetical protein
MVKHICNTHKDGIPPTGTKITGAIRSWPQFNHDMADVNDLKNGADVLAELETLRYFEARGRTWTFSGKLEVPLRTADDGDFLRMAKEAFHAAAGPRTQRAPRTLRAIRERSTRRAPRALYAKKAHDANEASSLIKHNKIHAKTRARIIVFIMRFIILSAGGAATCARCRRRPAPRGPPRSARWRGV